VAFRGTFDYTLDAKNRLTVPAKFRAAFADGVVLARRHDAPCLSLWRSADFEGFMETVLAGFNPLSDEWNKVNRFYNGYSVELPLDSAGRVMVPAKFLETVGIGRDVSVTGAGNCLEVWDRSIWDEQHDALADDVKQITQRLGNPA
jgi:MraZ protein